MDHLCYFCLVFCKAFVCVCLYMPFDHLLGKGMASLLSFVMSNCEVVTFPLVSWARCGALIVSIPDHCPLSYFGKGFL